MSEQPGAPRLVIVHDDPRATLALKRVLELEIGAEVLGAGGWEATLSRIDRDAPTAVLLHWPLPDGEAYELLWKLAERPSHPPVLAFSAPWQLDDIRRLVQLGVVGVLEAPLQSERVLADLEALRAGVASVSIRRLLSVHGPMIYEQDEALWVTPELGTWQLRMADLAAQVRRRWLATLGQRAEALFARLSAKLETTLTTAMTKAVLAVLEGGRETLDSVAQLYQIDPRLLQRLMRRADRFAEVLDGEAQLVETLQHLIERMRLREQRGRSGMLVALQRASRMVLKGSGADTLLEGLHRLLKVPRSVVDELPMDAVQRLAARLLLEQDENAALDHARWVVLVHLLTPGRRTEASPDDAKALAALFGPKKLSADAIVDGLCALNPEPILRGLDLLALRHFAPVVAEGVRGPILTLLAAGRLGGLVDRRRVKALLAAVDEQNPVLVGPATWRSVELLLATPDARDTHDMVLRLLFATGARGSSDVPVLRDAMRTLLDAVPTALDLVSFIGACRDAIAGRLDPSRFAGLAAQPTGDASQLAAVGARAFEESRIRSVLEEFAHLRESLPDLDLAGAARRLPKAPPPSVHDRLTGNEVMRLQVLASLLSHQRTDEARIEILRTSHSPDARPRGEEAVALEAMARELGDPHTTALIRRRLGLTERPDAKVVREALAQGRLDAAFIAVQALHDESDDIASLLCAVALSLYEAGRGEEGAPLYRRALQVEPERLNALFALARLELEAHRYAEALPLALHVRKNAPHLSPGKQLLADVQAGLVRL